MNCPGVRLVVQAPPDVREDMASVQRQLEGLRFASRAAEERLTWRLMQVGDVGPGHLHAGTDLMPLQAACLQPHGALAVAAMCGM